MQPTPPTPVRSPQGIKPVKARALLLLAACIAGHAMAEGDIPPEAKPALKAGPVTETPPSSETPPAPDEPLPNRIQGDIGGLLGAERSAIKADPTRPMLLPFAFFDYGRLYARLDTFGVKTVPVAAGYLELTFRMKFDGYRTTHNAALQGIDNRHNSRPLGIGTFQETAIGGFFLYALHDVANSRGNLLEATYAAELKADSYTVYPEAGIEYYSANYTRYYYGVSGAESARSGYAAYSPSAAACPYLSALLEIPVAKGWNANLYLRRKWLAGSISNSPLVDMKVTDTAFAAIVAHFD